MNDGMPKSQMTLIAGLLSLFAMCVPCVGSLLYMGMFLVTMVLGFLAHSEASTTGEDTTQAKIGMAVSFLPGVVFVVAMVLQIFGVVGLAILDNM